MEKCWLQMKTQGFDFKVGLNYFTEKGMYYMILVARKANQKTWFYSRGEIKAQVPQSRFAWLVEKSHLSNSSDTYSEYRNIPLIVIA